MKKDKTFYFTFGTDPQYPFGESEFVKIYAESLLKAQEAFMKRYPNRGGSSCANYAFDYTEDEWTEVYKKYYYGRQPSDIIIGG